MRRTKHTIKGLNKLYSKVSIPNEDIELLREIAIKNDIKDSSGKYSYEKVHEMILFHNDFVFEYLNTFGISYKLVSPYATFRPGIRYIRAKALDSTLVPSFKRMLEYVDWHNEILDETKRSRIPITDSNYIECPKEEDFAGKPFKGKKQKEVIPAIFYADYMYKGVLIKQGKGSGQKGIVIKISNNGRCSVKLVDEPNFVYTTISNLILLTNFDTNII